jgi:hypothetical protein
MTRLGKPLVNTKVSQNAFTKFVAHVVLEVTAPFAFQFRVVTGFLTGHNTLRRHLFLLGLANSPVCRGCGVKEETSAHVLCE